jgi:hypothetical protein
MSQNETSVKIKDCSSTSRFKMIGESPYQPNQAHPAGRCPEAVTGAAMNRFYFKASSPVHPEKFDEKLVSKICLKETLNTTDLNEQSSRATSAPHIWHHSQPSPPIVDSSN